MTHPLERADKVLVALGHFDSRAAAQAAIAAGKVRVGGRVVGKSSEKISATARIEAEPEHPFVSRAGLKLAYALDVFEIDPTGWSCLDVGASTGGFTEVLLVNGAQSVVAVDVGRDQLHPRLRNDLRVTSLEATDARALTKQDVDTPPRLIVCDASFISLAKVLDVPLKLAAPQCRLVALIKPQFEVEKHEVGKGGVVREPALHQRVCGEVREWLEGLGWDIEGIVESPITGPKGNIEFLVSAVRL